MMINRIKQFFGERNKSKSLESQVVEPAFFERLENRELRSATLLNNSNDVWVFMGMPEQKASINATIEPNLNENPEGDFFRTLGIAYEISKTDGLMYFTGAFENDISNPKIQKNQFNGFITYPTETQHGVPAGSRLTDELSSGYGGMMILEDRDKDGLYATIDNGWLHIDAEDTAGYVLYGTAFNMSPMPEEGSGLKGSIELVSPRVIPGDINCDGNVDYGDIVRLSSSFGGVVGSRLEGDLDGNGMVDASDYIELKRNFGTNYNDVCSSQVAYDSGSVSSQSIPEPATAAILGAGLGAMVAKGTKRNKRNDENYDVLGSCKKNNSYN